MTITALKPLTAGGSVNGVRAEISATKINGDPLHPTWGGYFCTEFGLNWMDPQDVDAQPIHLCGPLAIRAMVRTPEGTEWGLDLAWADPDGVPHQWAMPLSLTGGDGVDGESPRARKIDRIPIHRKGPDSCCGCSPPWLDREAVPSAT